MTNANTVREARLEELLKLRVKALGGQFIKVAPVTAGVPDRLVLLPPGQIHLLELKAEGGTVSPIQRAFHIKARRCGVTVTVLTGRSEVLEWVRARGAELDKHHGFPATR